MKKIFCRYCDNEIFITDDKIKEAKEKGEDKVSVVCNNCSKQINIKLIRKPSSLQREVLASLIVIENVFGYKQKFPLYEGQNTIGRRNKGTIVDIPIITSDPSMDRNHCIISIVRGKDDNFKALLEDQDSITGTFLFGQEIKKKAKVELNNGDVLTIGATSIIYTTDID